MRRVASHARHFVFSAVLCVLLTSSPSQAILSRRAELGPDQVVSIHTALGYSTIVEFPEKPLSAVLGDQDAFKLEFVKNAITIKPLLRSAKSNLFVFTEYNRFNCTLSTGPSELADYIIHVSAKSDDTPSPHHESVRRIQKSTKYDGVRLTVVSATVERGTSPNEASIVLDVALSTDTRPLQFVPASIGVKQSHAFIIIESLYVDSTELKPGSAPVVGKIAILKQNLNLARPYQVVFAIPDAKSAKTHRITVTVMPPPMKAKPVSAMTVGK